MKNKRMLLIGLAAVGIVAVGIVLALLLPPVTTFLFQGTGEDFRNAGTCRARTVTASPAPTENVIVIVPTTPAPTAVALKTDQPIEDLQPTDTPAPVPTATEEVKSAYDTLYEQADVSMMKDIVNILLVGVDFSEERLTWNGKKEWHSDVMIVLSVNFEENRADLISLPRDTYAEIPNVKGIYKLNAAINCGGGLYKEDGSFNPDGLEKVCDAAEWMLGGIPVDYYYAVTMTSLKSLVDAFGGLDYDLDISFKIQGRSYTKGMQHMDGQAVLDYCRVRKSENGLSSSQTGDANRVNRQKRILVAFFEHMQDQNMIVKIPDILAAFQGELFTNCTPAQTAALATFAYGLNREDIGMYSMGGSQQSLFQWNFVMTDQENRVQIIKEVYGVDVDQYVQYTLKYARYRWGSMLYDNYISLCNPLQKYVQKLIDADNKLPAAADEPTADAPSDNSTEPQTEPPADTEKIDITVKLVWSDEENADGKRPAEVPVKLMANGKDSSIKGVIKEDPNVKDKWEITFHSCPKTENGAEIDYSVQIDKSADSYKTFKDNYTFRAEGSASGGFKLTGRYEPNTDTAAASGDGVQTRKYSEADRAKFEEFKQAVKDLKSIKSSADSAAKKARNGKSNRLNSAAQELLEQLEKTELLAIEVAQIFGYDKVKNFTTAFLPHNVGWSSSPWAVNYGTDSSFNAVRVDFN